MATGGNEAGIHPARRDRLIHEGVQSMWDVIVVGAGPGGSIAASVLAEREHDVCVLEKEALPRYKPCGGGLPPHVVTLLEELDIELEPYVENVADEVKFLYDFEEPVRADLADAPVTMVNRAAFDHGLIQQARGRGARLRERTPVSGVQQNETYCEVELDDGEVLQSRFVVGADGAGSRVARSIGLGEPGSTGVALDAEVKVDPETFRREQRFATFNISYVNKGYGWIFPKRDYLAMGVGGYDTSRPFPKLIRDYVQQSLPGASVEEMEIHGHPLPFFEQSRDVARGRVGLVGDAANMVDSLSGEGIFYAMKAGRQIAECISENLRRGGSDLSDYQHNVEQGIARELNWSKRLAKIFFAFPRKCYDNGVKDPFIVNYIKQVVVSEASYEEIYQDLWREIKKRMGSTLLRAVGFGG